MLLQPPLRGALALTVVIGLLGCAPRGDQATTASSSTDSSDSAPVAASPAERRSAENPAAEPVGDPPVTPPPAMPPSEPAESSSAAANPSTPPAASPPTNDTPPSTNASANTDGQSAAAEREPLFVGWETPLAALVISGNLHGYMEPCGCSELVNQKGGLARRQTFLQQMTERGWPVAPIDVGDQVRRFGRQSEIKFQSTLNGLRRMGYRAIALGDDDLRLSATELAAQTAAVEGQTSEFVCANVAIFDRALTPTFQVVQVGSLKIGVTAILGTAETKQLPASDFVVQDPAAGLQAVEGPLRQAGCHYHVLLAHASYDESQRLAKQFAWLDLVVTADGGEPLYQPAAIEGSSAVLVQAGNKGMYVAVVGLYPGTAGKPAWKYQRVPLDSRFIDSPEMLALLKSYQEQLQTAGLEGLAVRPVPHPADLSFVGSSKCAVCHEEAFEIWQGSRHAHATESLVHPGERGTIPRHHDPECLSCHVTGWNPEKYFPYESGYMGLEASKHLVGNGCENCHGPGSRHVAIELGEETVDDSVANSVRESMRLTLQQAAESTCFTCHDVDNSIDFHKPDAFEAYWSQIAH